MVGELRGEQRRSFLPAVVFTQTASADISSLDSRRHSWRSGLENKIAALLNLQPSRHPPVKRRLNRRSPVRVNLTLSGCTFTSQAPLHADVYTTHLTLIPLRLTLP